MMGWARVYQNKDKRLKSERWMVIIYWEGKWHKFYHRRRMGIKYAFDTKEKAEEFANALNEQIILKGTDFKIKRWAYRTGAKKEKPGKLAKSFKNLGGYVAVKDPDHPNAASDGYVLEHRKIAAALLGRPLYADEEVHHGPEGKAENSPRNLEVWTYGHPKGQRARDLAVFVCERYPGLVKEILGRR